MCRGLTRAFLGLYGDAQTTLDVAREFKVFYSKVKGETAWVTASTIAPPVTPTIRKAACASWSVTVRRRSILLRICTNCWPESKTGNLLRPPVGWHSHA